MRRTGGRLAAAALLVVALAAACSDGGEGTSTAAGGTTTTSEATTTTRGRPLDRYADYGSVNYDDPAHWLCLPDRADVCAGNLDSTTIEADGTLTVEPFEPADDSPIDCFYVYPTISRDPTPTSDWDASDDEEGYAAVNQVARLRDRCRVYAPIYRQRTLASLASRISGAAEPGSDDSVDPYADVLDAWKTYMAEHNAGRGVVLVGHSQGSAMLSRLIAEEIDPNPDVRAHLVAAYLAGWAVRVPTGRDVGGDFHDVPLCREPTQTGCVVTWASFRSTAPPPPNSFFGAPRTGEGVAGCTNPAALEGAPAVTRNEFPANQRASILASLAPDAPDAAPWVDRSVGDVTTPFVSLPGLITTECVSSGGFDYLSVTVHGDPSDPRADDIGGDLTPEWGLHLVDLNLVMGDVDALVGRQSRAYEESR